MKRMMMKASVTAMTLFASMLVFAPSTHAATTPDATNDIATSTFVQDLSVDSYDAKAKCDKHQRGYHIEMKNALGVVLAKVGFSLTTCTKGGMVVSKTWGAPWCWTSAITLWNCQNKDFYIEAQSKQTLPRAYIWRQWRFHLHYCVTWICRDQWPWVYIGGRGDGTFGTNGGLS